MAIQQHSLLRFSLRAILGVLLAASIVFAVAAPFVRHLGALQQWRLLGLVCAAASGAALTMGSICVRRYRVERQSGARHCLVPLVTRRKWFIASGANTVMGLVLLSAIALPIAAIGFVRPNKRAVPFVVYFLQVSSLAMIGVQLALSVAWFLWHEVYRSIELCQNGVTLRAVVFVPWSQILARSWDSSTGKLVLASNRFVEEISVPPELRERITNLFDGV